LESFVAIAVDMFVILPPRLILPFQKVLRRMEPSGSSFPFHHAEIHHYRSVFNAIAFFQSTALISFGLVARMPTAP
jgi:hypothetical protein